MSTKINNLDQKKPLYHIRTFGCQMNEHDSEYMAGMLLRDGLSWTDKIEEADIILINSCTIRNKAEEKAFSLAGRLYGMRCSKPNQKIGFCGCVAQREGERIFGRAPYIDLVFGTLNIQNLPQLIKRLISGERHICEIINAPIIKDNDLCIPLRANGVKAWLTIMEGCNNYCTYCVVPYVRGRERSKRHEIILKEAKLLAESGYKEITLLGQNVNSYGKDLKPQVHFSELLHALNKISGIERIRFVTSHPKDLTSELITAMSKCNKVCKHIHLPLQAGSDRILKRMGRGYTLSEYLDKIKALRDAMPAISITSDIICGFPGETEEEFDETIKALKEIQFDGLFSFKYSKRPQTAAAKMEDHIPQDISLKRLQRLQTLQNRICAEVNNKMVGKIVEVLIEGPSKKDTKKLTGRSKSNKVVNIPGPYDLIGKTINVKITNAKPFDLEGDII